MGDREKNERLEKIEKKWRRQKIKILKTSRQLQWKKEN